MSAQHTPGPWVIEEITPSDFHDCYILGPFNGVYEDIIATVRCTDLPQCMADARLIAAAPEMLAALEELFRSHKELADSGDAGYWSLEEEPVGKQALAAIAKATGQ